MATPSASFRFYAELNDFLAPERQACSFGYALERRASVKDIIECFGVPHTEVEIIIANGESVGFDHIVKDGDHISVYPMFESLDITPLVRLREAPLREPRFILDCHLGRLARYLRQFGFDTLYRNDYDDDELAQTSADEHRILLTRDRNLLKRSLVTHGYFVRETDPRRQLDEVIRRFDLSHQLRPFGRCTRCNGTLAAVSKQRIEHLLEPGTRKHFDAFWRCRGCGQVYWEGSHYESMNSLAEQLIDDA